MADPTFRAPITNPYSLDPFYSDVQLDFVDIDGDGDLDAFQGVFDGTVRFFRNIGSAASASFAAPTDSFGFGDVGGYARPAFGDLDGDGDLDAIVGKDSAGLSVFINTGSAANPAFTPAANFSGMPTDETGLDPVLVDIDGDGALDLFVGSTQGQTRFFRNSGTSQAAAFVEVTDSFSLGDVGLAASPAFADIDGDGDLDAFIGNSVGVTTFFRNTGAPFSPAFTQEMDNFGITTFAGRVQVALADIDADGDIDALIGSLSKLQLFLNDAAGVRLIQTAGGTAVGEGRLSDTYAVALNAAPSADVTITLSVRNGQVAPDRQTLLFTPTNWDVPQPVHLVAVDDTIGEGRHAAVIGHAVVSGDAAYNGLEAPSLLVQVDDNDLPIGTQMFGPVALEPFGLASSLPGGTAAWLDIDADGDQDAVIGTATGEIRVFLAADQGPNGPNLQLSGNSFGLTNMSGQAAPAAGDIDADGDFDLFIGGTDGALRFFRNEGSATQPAFVLQGANFGLGPASAGQAAALGDLDGDGDLDAIVGQSNGTTLFYRNAGTARAPLFKAEPAIALPAAAAGPVRATLVDIDGDGDLDAIVGSGGQSLLARNLGTATAPAFAGSFTSIGLAQTDFVAAPAFADLDRDGDLDALLGSDAQGRMLYQENTTPGVAVAITGADTLVREGGRGDSFSIALKSAPTAPVTITLATTTHQLALGAYRLTFDSTNWEQAQTISVAALDDGIGEGPHGGSVRFTVASADAGYQGRLLPALPVAIQDNDLPAQTPLYDAPVLGAWGLAAGPGSVVPVFADIDADGDQDALLGSETGGILLLRNIGSATQPVFVADTPPTGLLDLGEYSAPALVDIDGDGDLDAYIGYRDGTTRFLRNAGSANAPSFVREGVAQDIVLTGSYAEPAFADIDGDGDLDALIGAYGSDTLTFLRNQGSVTNPSFVAEPGALGIVLAGRFLSPRFLDLDGDGDQDLAFGRDFLTEPVLFRNTGTAQNPVYTPIQGNFGLTLTGQYTRPAFVDLDGDGDQDAVTGNISGELYWFRNAVPGIQIRQSDGATAVDENGTTDSYTVQLRTAPTANVTITLNTTNHQVLTSTTSLVFTPANWNQPQAVTVSAVDDQLGESGAGLGIVRHTVASADGNYNNRAVPDLRVAVTDNDLYTFLPNFVTGDTNPFGISGGGAVAAVPVLADLDADGDLDAVIGYDDGSLKYFRNTSGNSDAPNFVLQVGDLGLGTGGSGASPTFGDLDGDGDLDAIVGLTSGALRLLRNTGTATAPAFTLDTTDIGLATADASVRPALVDIDADGDLDLVVGTSVGTLRLHRNTGSASAPQFTLVANNYGPGTIGASARPTFADIDGDGDFDAAIGDQDGVTHLLLNVGTAQDASFQQTFGYGLPSTPNVTFSAAPAFGDIDTDGDVDLLVGNLLGGTRLYLNDSGLDMPALDPIEFTDTPLDDVFAVRTSRARGSGADNQVMTYGLQGGTDNGTTVSLVDPLGTLSLHKTTGVASFSPVGGAINALSGPQSLAYTVTFTDGQSAAVANLEVRFLQIGTTESTGNNNLLGGPAADRFSGLAGNDTLSGSDGDDTLIGGPGNDTLEGDAGTDTADYSAAASAVKAELWRAFALVDGDGGQDALRNIEVLVGSAHNDTLAGGDGNDRLSGGGGADGLYAGNGNDTLAGGAGNDTQDGGPGIDLVDYSAATGPVTAELWRSFALNDGQGGQDALWNIEALLGSTFNDILAGGNGNDSLGGGAGNDGLYAGAGNDTLIGGTGNDTLDGGANIDTVDYSAATSAVTAELWRSFALNDGQGGQDALWNIERLIGSAFNDLLAGGSGNEFFSGGAGNDGIYAAAGVDTLIGGAGNDTLDGGTGIDVVDYSAAPAAVTAELWRAFALNDGQGGQDALWNMEGVIGSAFNDLMAGGAANEVLVGNAGNDGLYAADGIDTLMGGAGNDTMDGGPGIDAADYAGATGPVTAELWRAFASNDGQGGQDALWNIEYLLGSAFADLLAGTDAANYLGGRDGADQLFGAGGSDTLAGGLGNDTLNGGAGLDVFLFDTALGASNVDRVQDFVVVDDTVLLENAVFTALVSTGTLAAGLLRAGAGITTAADSNDFILYNSSTGALYYDADGSGTGAAPVQFALLGTGLALTVADFVVI